MTDDVLNGYRRARPLKYGDRFPPGHVFWSAKRGFDEKEYDYIYDPFDGEVWLLEPCPGPPCDCQSHPGLGNLLDLDDLPEAFRPRVPDLSDNNAQIVEMMGYNAALRATDAAEWRARALRAEAALRALGVAPYDEAGYCFCLNEAQRLAGHTGECLVARAALAQAKGAGA